MDEPLTSRLLCTTHRVQSVSRKMNIVDLNCFLSTAVIQRAIESSCLATLERHSSPRLQTNKKVSSRLSSTQNLRLSSTRSLWPSGVHMCNRRNTISRLFRGCSARPFVGEQKGTTIAGLVKKHAKRVSILGGLGRADNRGGNVIYTSTCPLPGVLHFIAAALVG